MSILTWFWPSLALALAIVALPGLTPGADAVVGGRPADLREAFEQALARAPEQTAQTAREAEVAAFAARARGLLSGPPAVGGLYRSDSAGGDGVQEMELGLELPLWRPGERAAERQAADRRAEGLDRRREALALRVAGQVREAVWEAAYRQSEVQLARRELETARALERDVGRRVDAGELAQSDRLLAREEALRRETALIQAQAEAAQALLRYQNLTGFAELPADAAEARSPLTDLTPGHALLAAADAGMETARAGLRVAERAAGGSPQLSIGGKRERGAHGEDYENSLQLAVRVPFDLGPAAKPAVASAGRELAEAQAERLRVERELGAELAGAAEELASLERRLGLAREQGRIAAENLRLARRAFDLGETDLSSLQRVQALAFAAERASAQTETLRRRAVARYNQAAGVLP